MALGTVEDSLAQHHLPFWVLTIGSTKLWFPSRRSDTCQTVHKYPDWHYPAPVASHRGGLSLVLDGHCRFGRSRGLNCRYFFHGSRSIGMVSVRAKCFLVVVLVLEFWALLLSYDSIEDFHSANKRFVHCGAGRAPSRPNCGEASRVSSFIWQACPWSSCCRVPHLSSMVCKHMSAKCHDNSCRYLWYKKVCMVPSTVKVCPISSAAESPPFTSRFSSSLCSRRPFGCSLSLVAVAVA